MKQYVLSVLLMTNKDNKCVRRFTYTGYNFKTNKEVYKDVLEVIHTLADRDSVIYLLYSGVLKESEKARASSFKEFCSASEMYKVQCIVSISDV